MMLSPSTVPWDPCPLGSALAPSLPLSAAGAGVSQYAAKEWMQLEGLGVGGLQGPALPLLPFPGKQAGRRQAGRKGEERPRLRLPPSKGVASPMHCPGSAGWGTPTQWDC